MKTKNKIGALLVLGGIALLGVYYFKKNKPTVAESQTKELEKLSNDYKDGNVVQEKMTVGAYTPAIDGLNFNLGLAKIDFLNLTPKEKEALLNIDLSGLNFDNFKKP